MPCEVCGSRAVDIHHIHRRGMGGSTDADKIENLMAVCRTCHIEYGDKKHYIDFLIEEEYEFDFDEKSDTIIVEANIEELYISLQRIENSMQVY